MSVLLIIVENLPESTQENKKEERLREGRFIINTGRDDWI
jgi:hypothetical protein